MGDRDGVEQAPAPVLDPTSKRRNRNHGIRIEQGADHRPPRRRRHRQRAQQRRARRQHVGRHRRELHGSPGREPGGPDGMAQGGDLSGRADRDARTPRAEGPACLCRGQASDPPLEEGGRGDRALGDRDPARAGQPDPVPWSAPTAPRSPPGTTPNMPRRRPTPRPKRAARFRSSGVVLHLFSSSHRGPVPRVSRAGSAPSLPCGRPEFRAGVEDELRWRLAGRGRVAFPAAIPTRRET